MSAEGREQAMQFLKPCDIFGDIAIWTNNPYPCTVVALEPVDVWMVKKRDVYDLIQHYPDLATAFIQHLGKRVMHYITLVEDLSLRNVEARLAKNLYENIERDGDLAYVPRRGWTTFDEIAVRLGTVRDVLSRALQNLEKEGLLRVERKAILILDEDGLQARGEA
jgi:CRP/FNR family transcriptional regulator